MTVYLDINVVLDYLLGNRRFGIEAAQVMTLLYGSEHGIYTAPNSIIMAYAFLRKEPDRKSPQKVKHTLTLFRRMVEIVPVSGEDIDKALATPKPEDLEDGFQVILAKKCQATVIITNDKKGFRDASMPVVTTAQFLQNWEF